MNNAYIYLRHCIGYLYHFIINFFHIDLWIQPTPRQYLTSARFFMHIKIPYQISEKKYIDSRLKICLRYIRRRVINFLFANVLCIRFLIDEAFKLGTSRSKKELFYLIHEKSFKNDEKGFLFHLTHYLSHCWLTNNSSTCIDQYVKK